MTARTLIVAVTWLTFGAFGPELAMGQGASPWHPASGPPTTVIPAERHDVSPPLASIPAEPEPQAPVFREIPRQPLPRRGPKSQLLQDRPLFIARMMGPGLQRFRPSLVATL